MNKRFKILIIDDNPAIHEDFKKILTKEPIEALDQLKAVLFEEEANDCPIEQYLIESALQGEEGIEKVRLANKNHSPFALTFVDVRMPPGLDGIETILKIWELDKHIQTVICTAYSDYSWSQMAKKMGHTDRLLILKKPFDNIEVLQLAKTLTHKYALQLEVQKHIALLNETLKERAFELETSLTQLQYHSTHDTLTKLPNRTLVKDRAHQTILHNKDHQNAFAIMFLDLNKFKWINDTLGHTVGDQLLITVAERLKKCIGPEDTLGHYGSDEFIFILNHKDIEYYIIDVIQKINQQLNEPVIHNSYLLSSTPSIGISLYPKDGNNFDSLVHRASIAMHQARKMTSTNFQFYQKNMNKVILKRMQMEKELKSALENKSFTLHYQPLLSCQTNQIVGMEALLRWHHSKLGFVSPTDFIPIAEETGLIVPLGLWVLETACEQNVLWHKSGLGPLKIAVNVSVVQMEHPDFLTSVEKILADTGLDPRYLEIEITESLLITNNKAIKHILQKLKEKGIKISIDDFGTGYSSLSYLSLFPIDKIKIDRSFVMHINPTQESKAIILAIIAMGHAMQMQVLAEGIETKEQYDFLSKHHCDEAQGYFIAKPMSAENIQQFILQFNTTHS